MWGVVVSTSLVPRILPMPKSMGRSLGTRLVSTRLQWFGKKVWVLVTVEGVVFVFHCVAGV